MNRFYRYIFRLYVLFALLAALIGSAVYATPVFAAGIVVNGNGDTIANNAVCTLREAIIAANNDTAYNGCSAGSGADTITFAGNYTITLGSQLPIVTTTMTISGKGPANTIITANSGSGTYRVLEISAAGNLTLNQVTVRDGFCYSFSSCSGYGGNIYSDGTLTLTNSIITYGTADIGAGVFNNGTMTVANSTVLVNNAEFYAGGIYNGYSSTLTITNSTFTNNAATQNAGGAISSGGTLTITDSTFSANQSEGSDAGGINNAGTLIMTGSTLAGNTAYNLAGGINNAGTMTITNSTFSGNNAYNGGGIFNTGSMTVVNNTFSGNKATISGGGIYNAASGTLKNTIVANSPGGGNCSGAITNGGNNLDSGSTCGWGVANNSMSNVDPKLGPLAANGGSTQTFALLTGSPAIEKGTNTGCPGTDQRGISRPRGAHCDIGAYEIPFPLTPTFTDVPASYLYYPDIEILSANGLTGGCSTAPLKFCPGDLMNRGQASVFMIRGTYGAGYVPPGNLVYKFNNDDWSKGTWARPWAEAMLSTGLTTGCSISPLLYCPWVNLPREQVVIFALKMKYGNSYLPPAATGTIFADLTDPNYYATSWAEKAFADGLIEKCTTDPVTQKPQFCPKVLVTRGLAAYIIVRAKSLTMP